MEKLHSLLQLSGNIGREQGWHSCESTHLPPMWPSLIPGVGITCGLSLLLVLVPAPRVFLRVLQFSSLHITNISKFQFDLETVERRSNSWIPLKFPLFFVIDIPCSFISDFLLTSFYSQKGEKGTAGKQ